MSVTVTSILRMQELKPGSRAIDQSYGTMSSTLWSVIEPNTGILCACLPLLKVPIMAWFPRLFAPSNNNASSDGVHPFSSASPNARRPSGMARFNIFSHFSFPTLFPHKISHSWPAQQSPPTAPSSNPWRCSHTHRRKHMGRGPTERSGRRRHEPPLEGRSFLNVDRETAGPSGAHGSSRSIASRGGLVPHETHELV